MRHYPWIIMSARTDELEKMSEVRRGLDSLFPQPMTNPDAASMQTGLETGARVGLKRNLEFSAGGRAHRIITGSYTKA
jgi:hypothetical protein